MLVVVRNEQVNSVRCHRQVWAKISSLGANFSPTLERIFYCYPHNLSNNKKALLLLTPTYFVIV